MKRAVIEAGLALVCSVLLGASDAQAWWWGGGGYMAGYSPACTTCGYGARYVTAGYSPWVSSYGYASYGMYGGGYSSCGVGGGCSPCGVGACGYGGCATGACGYGNCGGCGLVGCASCAAGCPSGDCPTGGCGLDYSQPSRPSVTPREPTPANVTPRTYIDEPAADEQTVPQTDPGFRRREERDESTETDVFGGSGRGPEAERGEAYKIPRESIIQHRRAAPTQPVDRTDEGFDDAGPQLAPLNLDGKVTWRIAPQRTRVSVEAVYRAPQIARAKSRHNQQWVPVSDTPRLVKK